MLEIATKPTWMRLRGSRDPAEAILSHFEVRSAPVPVHQIATWLGVTVITTKLAVTGVLDPTDAHDVRIQVNASDSAVRQRFTIAHELGHLMLHPLSVQYRDYITSPRGGLTERQANRFAVDLLMPEWLVRPAFRWLNGDLDQLADYFEVSKPAMEIRFHELYG